MVYTEIRGKDKGREKKRISRGTWYSKTSSSFLMRDLVDMVDEEQKDQAAERAQNYTSDHGVLLGLRLKEWTQDVKDKLRDERKQEKLEKEMAERQKVIDRRNAVKEMRAQAKQEAEEAEKEDPLLAEDGSKVEE